MYKYLVILMVAVTVVGLVITKQIADRVREDTVSETTYQVVTHKKGMRNGR